jgi:hypothetical protein
MRGFFSHALHALHFLPFRQANKVQADSRNILGGRRSTQEQSAEYANINTRYLHKLESGRGHPVAHCALPIENGARLRAEWAAGRAACGQKSRFWGSRFEAKNSSYWQLDCLSGKAPDFSGKNPLWNLFVCPAQGVDLSLPLIGPAAAVLSTVRTRDEVRLVTNPVNRCNAGRAGGKITRSELGDAS